MDLDVKMSPACKNTHPFLYRRDKGLRRIENDMSVQIVELEKNGHDVTVLLQSLSVLNTFRRTLIGDK